MTATLISFHRHILLTIAIFFIVLAGIFSWNSAALAAPTPLALVQTVSGDIKVQRALQANLVSLSRRSGLYAGDKVSTGAASKTSLLFGDGSQVRLNANAAIEITARTPLGHGKFSLFRTLRGTVMAQLRPNNAVQTRSAIAGVRGTVFTLNVEENRTVLTVLEGEVEFYNAYGTTLVDPSQQSTAIYGSAPSAPITIQNPGLTIEWTLDLERAFIPREKFYVSLDPQIVRAVLAERRQKVAANPSNAKLLIELGDALFDNHNYSEAIEQYNAAHQLSPASSKSLVRIGNAFLEQDRLQKAETYFRQALNAEAVPPLRPASFTTAPATSGSSENPETDDALIGLSWIALRRNRAPKATSIVAQLVAPEKQSGRVQPTALTADLSDAADGGAHIVLGLSLMRQSERYQQAIAAFENAARQEPPRLRYQAHSWLAMMHLAHNNLDASLREATEATQLQPYSGLAFSNLSLVLFYANRPREAQRAAQKAVDIDADSIAARCALGQALLASGNVDAASREAAHAVALDPNEPQARYLLGLCDASRRDYSHAVIQLRESVEQAPDFLPAVTALARVYTGMGRKQEAVTLLSDLLPDNNRNADGVHAALGLVRYEQGDYRGAADEYRRAIGSKPQSALYHAELARTLLYSNQLNAAIESAQQSIKLAPDIGQYHAILGMAYDYSGLKSQAERELREALQLDPGNALALTQLAYRHVGSDLRPAAASFAQGFLRDPSVASQLLRGGVETELTPSGGSRGTRNLNFTRRIEAADGKLRALGFLNRGANSGTRENDRTRATDIGTYVTYQANPHTNLYLNLRRVRSQRGLFGLESQPDDDDTAKQGYGQAQIALRRRLGERNALWLGLFRNTSRNTTRDAQRDSFFDTDTGLSIARQQFDSHALMPELRLDLALGDSPARPSMLVLGIAQAHTTFRRDRDFFSAPLGLTGQGISDRKDDSLMAYVQWERRMNNRFGFIAQLRAQRVDENNQAWIGLSNGQLAQTNDDRTRHYVLPSLLANYRAGKRTNLRLTAGMRHTDSTASTFAPVETLLATERSASPFGTPQTQNTLQFDIEQNVTSKTFLKLWAFDNSARNVHIGGSDYLGFGGGLAAANAPSIQLARWHGKGIGARVEQQVGRRLFVNLGMVARETSNRSNGAFFNSLWDGGEAPYEPSRLGNLDLNYVDPKGNKVGLRLRHVGSFFADSPLALGRPRFGAQNYVDLRLAREPSVAHEFFVQLSNVLDQPEISFQGFPARGRRFEFGMTQRF